MRIRSWMAALALAVNTSIAVPALAQSRSQSDQAPATDLKPRDARSNSGAAPGDMLPRIVELHLVIAGLGREGCDVEVKPGNASCKFRVANEKGVEGRQHVSPAGQMTLKLNDVELSGADRTCSVAITVHEPGQTAKTVYRGFRLSAKTEAAQTASTRQSVPSFTCYLSAPSRVARSDSARMRK